jgi:hypothetical protein
MIKTAGVMYAFWEQFPSGVRGWVLLTLIVIVVGIGLRVSQLMAAGDAPCPEKVGAVCVHQLDETELRAL